METEDPTKVLAEAIRALKGVLWAVELFDGSVTDNIARFDEHPDPGLVIAAAKAAQVHDMILKLSDGYETRVGDRGKFLSAGQRQRIALARALYKDPFFIVLDEPNSNLDAEGEKGLLAAIAGVKARNGIAIIIAHRPAVLATVDLLAIIGAGQLTAFGDRDEIMRKAFKPAQSATPLTSQLALVGDAPR